MTSYTNTRPKKSLGQNFLADENIARKIISSLNLTKNDNVLEIGPGQGVLTKYLVEETDNCFAVEIDRSLIPILKEKFSQFPSFKIIEDDFLNVPLEKIFLNQMNWKVVGNIPYHITSSIIFKSFEYRKYIKSLTLMIQKEVAQRIVANPNTKTYGIPSVLSQLFADVKILFFVSKNVFKPKPKIDSAVIRWEFLAKNRYKVNDEQLFVRVVKTIFSQRRKVIRNTLKNFEIDLDKINFALDKRPEQLSVKEIVEISNEVAYGRKRS